MKNAHLIYLVGLGAAALALVLVAYLALTNYEVVEKGKILPYTNGYVYRILIADKYTVFVEPEIRLRSDVFNAAILIGVAYISLTFAAILHVQQSIYTHRHFAFFVLMSAGMFFLAADELLGIHESIGHNVQFLTKIPGISRPDDLIIALYAIVAILFLFSFRSLFSDARRPLQYFSAALGVFVVAAVADLATIPFEEIIELVAGTLILAGIISFGLVSLQKLKIKFG